MSSGFAGLFPFVERALDSRERVEALGPDGQPPRATGSSGWGAAREALDRLD